MAEFWDVYDKSRNKTGRLAQRGVDKLKEGEYHIVVTAVILNSQNEILITQRADFKDIWIFRKDVKDEEITLPDGESVSFKWVSIDEFEEMFRAGQIVPSVDFDRSDWEKAINLI